MEIRGIEGVYRSNPGRNDKKPDSRVLVKNRAPKINGSEETTEVSVDLTKEMAKNNGVGRNINMEG